MQQPIGIIDSGVGGLSVWKEINKLLPKEAIIYLADSANIPYGTKSEEEIYQLAKRLVSYLIKKDTKLIVIACNTITVTCLEKLRNDFPTIPIVGTVPVIKTAARLSKTKRIGVLSTVRTSESTYQNRLIKEFAGDCVVISQGTDQLVPLVEKGNIDEEHALRIVQAELEPFIQNNIDVIVLGCTHFPFLKNAMQRVLRGHVAILDSAVAIARQTKRMLETNKTVSYGDHAHDVFLTTGEKAPFASTLGRLVGVVQNATIQKVHL